MSSVNAMAIAVARRAMAVAARRSRSACTHPIAARVVTATRYNAVSRRASMAELLNAKRPVARSIVSTSWF